MQREAPATPVVQFSEPPQDIRACAQRFLAALGQVGERLGLATWMRTLGSRGEVVATFIGLLEMMRRGWIGASQEGAGQELWVWLEVNAEDVVPEWLEAVVERPEEEA